MDLLIVNDEMISAKALQTGIQWKEYGIDNVSVAFDAKMAKKQLTEHIFDVILCDIEMPGESGIDLIRWVREQQMETEVIFLTCHADFEFAQEAIRLKCRNYILVPADYDVVAENVHEVVRMIQEQREARKKQEFGQLWIEEKKEEFTLQTISRAPEKTVENVKEYIGRHLTDPELGVQQIADSLYLNADYLNRVFKRMKGTSIGQYILKKRMSMAVHLLSEEKLGATRVSEIIGYNSYSSFVAAFKSFYGCSPSKYLEQQKGDG